MLCRVWRSGIGFVGVGIGSEGGLIVVRWGFADGSNGIVGGLFLLILLRLIGFEVRFFGLWRKPAREGRSVCSV